MTGISYLLIAITILLLSLSNLFLWFSLFKLRKDFVELLEILKRGFGHDV